jgi:hypothetical protein
MASVGLTGLRLQKAPLLGALLVAALAVCTHAQGAVKVAITPAEEAVGEALFVVWLVACKSFSCGHQLQMPRPTWMLILNTQAELVRCSKHHIVISIAMLNELFTLKNFT